MFLLIFCIHFHSFIHSFIHLFIYSFIHRFDCFFSLKQFFFQSDHMEAKTCLNKSLSIICCCSGKWWLIMTWITVNQTVYFLASLFSGCAYLYSPTAPSTVPVRHCSCGVPNILTQWPNMISKCSVNIKHSETNHTISRSKYSCFKYSLILLPEHKSSARCHYVVQI